MNGESEHIHLLLNYPPKVSISKLVKNKFDTRHSSKEKKVIPIGKSNERLSTGSKVKSQKSKITVYLAINYNKK